MSEIQEKYFQATDSANSIGVGFYRDGEPLGAVRVVGPGEECGMDTWYVNVVVGPPYESPAVPIYCEADWEKLKGRLPQELITRMRELEPCLRVAVG